MMRLSYIFFTTIIFVLLNVGAMASDENQHEEFKTIDFIFEHVNDSHEWFFFSLGDKHVSLPLPVIIYSEHTGWHFFSSNKLYHHENEFPFTLGQNEENEGKIIELLADGSEFIPYDFSITKTVLGLLLVSTLMLFVFIQGARKAVNNKGKKPVALQNIVEMVVLFVREEIAKPFAGPKYKRYLPYLLTLFTFVLLANVLGLILPLGFNITGNIAVTFVLAAITFIITSLSGNKQYWGHIVNPDVPFYMKLPVPLMPLIEFAGIFIKPIILMIRLFANMLAGHMIVAVLIALIFLMSSILSPIVGAGTSIISILFSIFMVLLDLLVSFIQAYIFALLSAMYIGMATDKAH